MGFVKHGGTSFAAPDWPAVAVRDYRGDGTAGATKRILVGPADGAEHFAIRYFEVPAGQNSSLDEHQHDHGVIIVRGSARVRLGDTVEMAGVGDVVYIAPGEIHQLENTGDGPLGFLCIVPGWAEKDDRASCLLPNE